MILLIFSMAFLSALFIIIFGMWWDGYTLLKIYLIALIILAVTIISIILSITFYSIIKSRFIPSSKKNKLSDIAWGNNVSNKLSTPAAVLNGYTVIFANKMFLSNLGLSGMRRQVINMPITNLVHPSDHGKLAKIFSSRSSDNDTNETTTIRMLYIDGTTIPVHMSLSPLNDDISSLNLLQFSSISPHKLATINIGEQFDYNLILDRIVQIVFKIDTDKKLIFINSSWERILDYSKQESLGNDLLSFIHPEDILLVEASLSPLTQGKRQHCHIETRVIAKNGASCWVDLRAATTSSLKGERTSIVGTLTDINRMKQSEISLKSNPQSPINMILPNLPAMIYRCKNDRDWTFDYVSDGCFEVTGYQSYEIVRAPNFSYMKIIHADDQSHAWNYIQEQIAKEQNFHLIYRIITRSGHSKWVLERGEGVFSSTGELLSLEGFIAEISSTSDNITNELLISLQQLLTLPEKV